MWKARWSVMISVLGLFVGACLWGQVATPLSGGQQDESAKSEAKSDTDQEKEIDIRYAEAYLKVMQATLAKYEETNRRAANTIRPSIIEGIQAGVQKARERVQLAKSDETEDSQIYVTSAEANLRMAEEALRRAQAANARSANAISAGEVNRLKSLVELAKVRIDKARHLASESPLSNVRYELELLREDVQELQLFVALLRFRN